MKLHIADYLGADHPVYGRDEPVAVERKLVFERCGGKIDVQHTIADIAPGGVAVDGRPYHVDQAAAAFWALRLSVRPARSIASSIMPAICLGYVRFMSASD